MLASLAASFCCTIRSRRTNHQCYHPSEMPRASTPSQQLSRFLAKYTPKIAAQGRRALAKMRKLLPGSTEMVYDNYNGLVIGFGPTEKPSLAIFSILLMPDHVTLCFLQGASLPDPNRRLKGGGTSSATSASFHPASSTIPKSST